VHVRGSGGACHGWERVCGGQPERVCSLPRRRWCVVDLYTCTVIRAWCVVSKTHSNVNQNHRLHRNLPSCINGLRRSTHSHTTQGVTDCRDIHRVGSQRTGERSNLTRSTPVVTPQPAYLLKFAGCHVSTSEFLICTPVLPLQPATSSRDAGCNVRTGVALTKTPVVTPQPASL